MATEVVDLPHPAPHTPLRHTRMTPTWQGGKMTNTEARELVAKLRRWAKQFNHPDARNLDDALEDVEALFCTVWGEIDEALTRFMLMEHDAKNAAEHRRVGMRYLHRWQDRGGKIGNADFRRDASPKQRLGANGR